jgi:hypothetical protein
MSHQGILWTIEYEGLAVRLPDKIWKPKIKKVGTERLETI